MPRRRTFRSRALSMTPLIDVIFLLLLFFMLTSTFTRFAEVPLVQAAAGSSAEEVEQERLFLRLAGDGISLNGQPLPADFAPAIAVRLDDSEMLGLLSVTRDVTSQDLIETLTDLRRIKGLTIAVLQ